MEFSEFFVEKMLVSFSNHARHAASVMHMFMVTILIMVVSETVLLMCKCVYFTVLISSFFHFMLVLCFFFFVALVLSWK